MLAALRAMFSEQHLPIIMVSAQVSLLNLPAWLPASIHSAMRRVLTAARAVQDYQQLMPASSLPA